MTDPRHALTLRSKGQRSRSQSYQVETVGLHVCLVFSARCMLQCQCPSVTEVHWRIIANLGFKFRSKFTAHSRRGEGSSQQQHLALC